MGLSWWHRQKRICLQHGRPGFDPWVGTIPWRKEWQPTPVFWPGEFHGQRRRVSYSVWGCKASNATEQLMCMSAQTCARAHTHTQNKEQKTAPGKRNFETFTLPPTKNTKVCILRFIFWFKCQLEVLFEKSGRWERCLTKNDNLAQLSHVLVASSK